MGCSGSSESPNDEATQREIEENRNYDWTSINDKLPIGATEEDRQKRIDLWMVKMGFDAKQSVTFDEIENGINTALNLPALVSKKKPIKMAFDAAKDKYKGKKEDRDADYTLQWNEFRIFLLFLKQFFEYWQMFNIIDSSGDHKIQLSEFRDAVPTIEKWGVKIEKPDVKFREIDINKAGCLTFKEFCNFAILSSLNLEGNLDYDNDALELLKKTAKA